LSELEKLTLLSAYYLWGMYCIVCFFSCSWSYDWIHWYYDDHLRNKLQNGFHVKSYL